MAANERLFGCGMLMVVSWACLLGGGDFTSGLSETKNSSKNQEKCQMYNGTHCRNILNSSDYRFINSTLGFDKTEILAVELDEQFKKILTPDSSETCKKLIGELLCYYVFPPCSDDGEKIEYCREDCTYLFKICGDELQQVRGAGAILIFNTSYKPVFTFRDCNTYPPDNPEHKKKCRHLPILDIPPPAAEPAGISKVLIIVLSIVGSLMCLSILAIFLYCRAANKKRAQSVCYENGKGDSLSTTDRLSNVITMRDRIREWKVAPSELTELIDICKSRGVHEIAVDDIEYLKDLGSGQYGLVFQGKLPEVIEDETVVAVKTLREGSSQEAIKEFCQEVNIMSTFSHPNVVRLLAVALAGEPYCMIFEFVEFGDLSSFLRNCAEAEEGGSSGYPKLTVTDQLSMALQVANGMKYISSIRCVHRDLAARNCLVGRELFIKISDFGLSRDVCSSEYYMMDKTRMLPVRWLPPEAFVDGKFTTYSDIYSYGVLMWEIFTFAKLPYEEYDNEIAMGFILEGQILEKPDECSDPVYDIMKRCWVTNPKERIPFPEIIDELCSLDDHGLRFTTEDGDAIVENYHGRMPPQDGVVSFQKGFNNLTFAYSMGDLDGPPINVVHGMRKDPPPHYYSLPPTSHDHKASGEEQGMGNGVAYDGVVTLSEAGRQNKSLPGQSCSDVVGPEAIHRMTPPQDEMHGYHNRSNSARLENQRETSTSLLISKDLEKPEETYDERRQMSPTSEPDDDEGLEDTYVVPPVAQGSGYGDHGESQKTYDSPPSSHGTPVPKRSLGGSSEQWQMSRSSDDDEEPEDTYVVPPISQRSRHGDYGEPHETYDVPPASNVTQESPEVYGETYDIPPAPHVPSVSLRPPQPQDTYAVPPSPSQNRLRQKNGITRDGDGSQETYDIPTRHEENTSDELYQNAGNLGTELYCVPKSPFLERRNQNNGAAAGANQSTLTSSCQKSPYENVGFDGKPLMS